MYGHNIVVVGGPVRPRDRLLFFIYSTELIHRSPFIAIVDFYHHSIFPIPLSFTAAIRTMPDSDSDEFNDDACLSFMLGG